MDAGPISKSKKRRRENSSPPLRTLKQYSVEEKLEIIQFAKTSGNRAAGREFNVAESSIREWRKHEERLRDTAASTRASSSTVAASFLAITGQPRLQKQPVFPVSAADSVTVLMPLSEVARGATSSSLSSSSSSSPSTLSSSSPSSLYSLPPTGELPSPAPTHSSSSRRRKSTAPRKIILDYDD